jgi:hypothetical protein
MHAQLEEIGERELKDALEQGIIDEEQKKKKLSEFSTTVKK